MLHSRLKMIRPGTQTTRFTYRFCGWQSRHRQQSPNAVRVVDQTLKY